MKTEAQTMVQINEKAIRVLYKELGAVNAIRFLNQYSSGTGNYTRDREHLLKDLSLDQSFSKIETKRTKDAKKKTAKS